MGCDKKTLYIVESWDDDFGGEIWFKDLPGSCRSRTPTAEVRIKTPWGSSEYVYVTEDHFIKTYTSGNKIYSVDLSVFCGMESTLLQANTCYEIDKCKNVTCSDICAPDGTRTVRKCNPKTGGCITDHTEPLSDECTGSIKCQAYDSVTKNALVAKILFDNTDIGQVTPFTITKVTPGQHDISYILDGYTKVTNKLIVAKKVQSESNVSMIQLAFPGFDINVNVPRLPSDQSLRVLQVVKVPLTNQWYEVLIGSKVAWDNISNGIYKAREQRVNCDPEPQRFAELVKGRSFAIFAGDPVTAFHPEDRVFELKDTTTNISITKLAALPAELSKVCGWLDVSEVDCATSFYNAIPDILFSAEDLSIIIDGKSIYPPYDEKKPTPWNYAFVALTFIPGSGVIKGAGKAGVKIVKSSKLYPEVVQSFIRNARWTSGRDPHRPLTFMEAMFELKGPHLDEVVAKLELGNIDEASRLITKYLPLGKTPEDSVKDLGSYTSELFKRLPRGSPEILIREANLEKAFNMNVEDIIFRDWPPSTETITSIEEIFNKFPTVKASVADDITNILKDTSATSEQITKAVNAAENYTPIIKDIGSKTPLEDVDDLIVNAVNKVGYENTPKITANLFRDSLKTTLTSPNPKPLSRSQTNAIEIILKKDAAGFENALSTLDDATRLKYIKSLELSGIDGITAAGKTEGIHDIVRNKEIFEKFGYNIQEVAEAFTDNHISMPGYWSQLGVKSFEGAKTGKLIDLTPPNLGHLSAELAENKLSREVAENLVETKLLRDIITQIVARNSITNEEIVSLYQLYNKYPLQADEAIKQLYPAELADITRLLSQTEDGRTVLATWGFKTKLAEDIGVDTANTALDYWVKHTGGVYVDAVTRQNFYKQHWKAFTSIIGIGMMIPIWFMFQGQEFKMGMVGYGFWPTPIYLRWKVAYQKTFDVESILKADCNNREGIRLAKEVVAEMNWLINYCYENPIIEDSTLTKQLDAQYGKGRGSANEETILTMENQRDGFIQLVESTCPGLFSVIENIPESIDAEVIEIIDGDTVKIEYLGKEYDVRLLGINTPEKKTYKYTCTEVLEPFLVRRLVTPGKVCIEEETWHADQEFLDATKKWIGNMLPVHQISTFVSDPDDQLDDYGRILAIPFRNDKNICIESLKHGQSVVFFYDNNKWVSQEDFLYAENVAKKANLGIWSFLQETGWVRFVSKPTAADVYMDGEHIGKTVNYALLIETTLGMHDYEITKIGYHGCKGTILEVNKSHTERYPYIKQCILTLEEPPCPSPNASFVVSPTSPDVNENVTFDASASTAGGNESMKSYTWDFGDGTDATGRIVTHSYVAAGSYIAKLTVRNNCRETDVSTKTISVKGIIITGDITVKTYSAPGKTLSGVTVYIDNIDKGNAPMTIKDLPVGPHTVRLEISGYLGCIYCLGTGCQPDTEISPCDFSVTVIKDITRVLEVTMKKIHEITGWVRFVSKPTTVDVYMDGKYIGKTVNFALLIETTLGIHDYEFKKVGYLGCKGTILEVNKSHTEQDPYIEQCILTVEEPPCSNPNASFVISPTSPDVNETITFDASASTAGGNESMKSYTWDFGDGTNATGKTVTHTYISASSYVAKLAVKNDCGKTDISTKTVSVKEIIHAGDITVKTYSKPGTTLSGVVVYVDNIDKGNAPVTIKDLPIGPHQIRLEKSGYRGCNYCLGTDCQPDTEISPCDFSVTVIKDITRVLEVTMKKMHEIEISSIPEGATITVDGKPVTTSMNMIEMILAGKK